MKPSSHTSPHRTPERNTRLAAPLPRRPAALILPLSLSLFGCYGVRTEAAPALPPTPESAAGTTGSTPAQTTESPSTSTSPDATTVPSTKAEAAASKAEATASPSDSSPARPSVPRLTADVWRIENGIFVAESRGNPVRLDSETVRLQARSVWMDIAKRTVKAQGEVIVERDTVKRRRVLQPNELRPRYEEAAVTETLRGDRFEFDFQKRLGRLNDATVQFAGFDFEASSLAINGRVYTASDIILRPGGLTPEERKIYGTPPFNLRAEKIKIDNTGEQENPAISVSKAGFYFKNTRILPVPSYVVRSLQRQGDRDDRAFQLAPRLSFSSADGLLVTTQLAYPLLDRDPGALALNLDLGVSQRAGFRGGLTLDANTSMGRFALRGRVKDIVTTQLTSRIELDREPELEYNAPLVSLFALPGGRKLGAFFSAGIGRFTESLTGEPEEGEVPRADVSSTRQQALIGLTTRVEDVDGPYAELFARAARYPTLDMRYTTSGFELGYVGNLGRKVRGQFSYSDISLSGNTPFRFDAVEIARELRTTFDVQISPRYIIPIDLRYDLDLSRFRDERFGLLRSYKTFAYGATYDTARRELKFDFRSGF